MQRRFWIVAIVSGFCAIILFCSTFIAFSLVPSVPVSGIASVAIQASATLIGLVGIALFYYLGTVEATRKNFLATQKLVYETLTASQIREIEWVESHKNLRDAIRSLSGVITYCGIASIVAFACGIFLDMFAMILNNVDLLASGFVAIVFGISQVIVLVSQAQVPFNVLNDVLSIVETYALVSTQAK